MKSNMEVEVAFLVGTDIKDAIAEAKAKAILWNVAYVLFKFNEVSCSISQTCDVDKAVAKFYYLMEKVKDKSLWRVIE